ncbi:MADS-box protein AGL24 [Morella rubra]|uniref:MADS-box protein AGL24 n=1 Tax=Morella rubra TaxID=262757 RepID=A0A6A1V204_9ROSI|nr:MADS-box protein AGL24 [Morella rubra]
MGRYNILHPENLNRMDQQSLELQLENDTYTTVLRKEILEKTRELRRVKGEELDGLNTKELQELEQKLDLSLCRVAKKKDEMFLNEITALKRKMQDLSDVKTQVLEQGQSTYESPDTALKLGLPFPDH